MDPWMWWAGFGGLVAGWAGWRRYRYGPSRGVREPNGKDPGTNLAAHQNQLGSLGRPDASGSNGGFGY